MGNILTSTLMAASNVFSSMDKTIKVTNPNNGKYDPNTGTIPTNPTIETIICRIFDYSDKDIVDSGGLILQKDKRLSIFSENITCIIDDKSKIEIEDDPSTYSVIKIKEYVDGNTVSIQIRK